jgi:glycosyltransferase involved in cell wall biosynthesis
LRQRLVRFARAAAARVPKPVRRALKPFTPVKRLIVRFIGKPDVRVVPELVAAGVKLPRPFKKTSVRYSLVVPLHNVARYVDDFFYSVFAQSIDTECLEIIAVDDGSTDDTAQRIEAWSRRFPGRIKYLYQENQGQAVARNTGLAHTTGEWVSFPDPDDFFSLSYLEEVDAEIGRASQPLLSMISCNTIFFKEPERRVSNGHPLRFRFSQRRTELSACAPDNFMQLSAASAWFRRDLIERDGLRFDPRIFPNFEDSHLVNRYLLLNPDSKIVFLRTPIYYYRKRGDGTSTLEGSHSNPGWYRDSLRYGSIDLLNHARKITGRVPRFIQRTLLYDLIWRFTYLLDHPERFALPAESQPEFFALLREVIDGIDAATINTFEIRCGEEQKVGLLNHFKGERRPVTTVYVRAYDQTKRLLQLSYVSPDSAIDAIVHVNGKLSPLRHISRRRGDLLGHDYFYEHFFWVAVDRGASLTVRVREDLCAIKARGQHFGVNPSFRQLLEGLRIEANEARLPANVHDLRRAVTSKEARARYRDCWLFIDHDTKADNNAEHLYRYVKGTPHGESAYFILNKDSPDWPRLEADNFKLIPFGSDEHRVALANAELLASSDAVDSVLNPFPKRGLEDLFNYRFAFLQHGIIRDDISRWLNQKEMHLFIVSTNEEYKSVAAPESPYKFSSKEVAWTGLPRHDKLVALPDLRETILIMPTWRNYLVGKISDQGARREKSSALGESEFWLHWNELLQHRRLGELVHKYGVRVEFCPHVNFAEQLSEFTFPDYVKFINPLRIQSLQPYLASAAVLITDYSSVAFECAYKGKPVLYYQFDFDEYFRGGHASQLGYFDYARDGFGPVCETGEALFVQLEATLSGQEAPCYAKRRRGTFHYRDGKCCERIYESIQDLKAPRLEEAVKLKSYTRVRNAGDTASQVVVSHLTDARLDVVASGALNQPNLIALGSILHWSDERSVIWGTGILSDENPVRTLPDRVFAVRGPLSRQRLIEAGGACPQVYGDPGILISDLHRRRNGTKEKLGIIPHYMDRDEAFVADALQFGAHLIDVGQPLEDYLDALCECECILSSSLHGVIFAHSYGIPAAWVQLSEKVVGGGLKFRDYYASVGFNDADIPRLSGSDSIAHAVQSASLPREEIDRPGLKRALADAYQYLFDARERG